MCYLSVNIHMLIMHWVINLLLINFIVTSNIFEVIEAKYVINEPTNPSCHNIVLDYLVLKRNL